MRIDEIEIGVQYLYPHGTNNTEMRPIVFSSKPITRELPEHIAKETKMVDSGCAKFVLDDAAPILVANMDNEIVCLQPLGNWYNDQIKNANSQLTEWGKILSNLHAHKPA